MTNLDSRYLQLYQDYARAIRAYGNAVKDRQRVRARIEAKREQQPTVRRPIGSPRDYRMPPADRTPAPRGAGTRATRGERRIYLGETLGWATLVPSSGGPESELSRPVDPDADHLYDQTSLGLYWNAKKHYDRCKRAFFEHVRRQNIERSRERARHELSHAANLQMLGVNNEERSLDGARREIERACWHAWALYERGPKHKSTEVVVTLLEALSDAQFVGLENGVVRSMQDEFQRLVATNRVRRR